MRESPREVDSRLAAETRATRSGGPPVVTTRKTSYRVFRRGTDAINRDSWAAIAAITGRAESEALRSLPADMIACPFVIVVYLR